jgi:hypothetical protein
MPTTSGYALPYPSDSDAVDVPGDMQALAQAVDTQLTTVYGRLPHATSTARLTVTGLSTAPSDSIATMGTINWPAGRFSVAPVVVVTSNEDALAPGSYGAIFTVNSTAASATISFCNRNSSTTITKLSVNAIAIQMASGSATG